MLRYGFLFLLLLPICVQSQNVDINLLRNLNVNRNSDFDNTFKLFTHSATPVIFGVPAIIFSAGLIKKDSALKRKAFYLGLSAVVNASVTTVLKYTIRRKRPFETYSDIIKLTDGGSPSFPSGHTSGAFSTATSLSIAFPKWYVIAPSYLWACGVGYSRMHLGVHYPSDVAAGAIIGSGCAVISWWLNSKLNNKQCFLYR